MSVVKAVDSVKYSFFNKEPFSSQNIQFVYCNDVGDFRIVDGGEQLTNTELKAMKYSTRYTLDCSPLRGEIQQAEYPSSDESLLMEVNIDYVFRVTDPGAFVYNLADTEIHSYVQEKVSESVQQYVQGCSLSNLEEAKRDFPKKVDVKELTQHGIQLELTGGLDLTPEIKELVKEQFHMDLDQNFPSSDVNQEFFVHGTVLATIANPTLYMKSGISTLPAFVHREVHTQVGKLMERYFVHELEELQAAFPSKLNVSPLESKGIAVSVNGDVDLSKELKIRLSEKVNLRYIKEYPSEVVGENFEVTLQAIIRIKDRLCYLQSDISSLEQYVKDELDIQVNNITQKYSREDYSLRELRNNLVQELDLFEFEAKGLEVNLKTVVELSQDLKREEKSFRSKKMEISQQKDLKKLELVELIELARGNPILEARIVAEKDPDKVREYLLEQLNKIDNERDKIRDMYSNDNIDYVEYERKIKVLGGNITPSKDNVLKIDKPQEESHQGNSFSQSATLIAEDEFEDKDFN